MVGSLLDLNFPAGNVASISKVCEELIDGNDQLAEWAKKRKDSEAFLDVSDIDTQRSFTKIAAGVEAGSYSRSAKRSFLGKADPWLIAKAMVEEATIVTHEVYAAEAKRKVPIPNICQDFGVLYVNTFELLRDQSASFILPR